MQQAQQREGAERISWARAMIFAIGFFLIAAILIGQLPGYIYLQLTAASLQKMEIGSLGTGLACFGMFIIILVIVMLFDPKPVVPPAIFTGLGAVLSVGGFALMLVSTLTGCTAKNLSCNQYFPQETTSIAPLIGGKFLWFQPNDIDFLMIGTAILGIGLAMIFYSVLAIREQHNPDRRDPGTTAGVRLMIIAASIMFVIFLLYYTLVDNTGLALKISASNHLFVQKILDTICGAFLGIAVVLVLGALALRLHYLMRPVRKRTMAPLYAVGALGFAQLGAILILAWAFVYPLIDWMHSWSFIGLGSYLTVCSTKLNIPASCAFSPQAGYLVDTIVTMGFFTALMAAIWAWKSHRNLVVIGSIVTTAVIAATTLLIHMESDELLVALLLTGQART